MKVWNATRFGRAILASAAASLIASLAGCGGGGYGGMSTSSGTGTTYIASALVSDRTTTAYTDANLVNGWGLAFNPQGFVWVNDAATSKATLYDGHGVPQSLVVAIPAGAAGSASPTGIVFNGSQDFAVAQGGVSAPSAFLFVGEAGTLSGWSPTVDQSNAITVFDGALAGAVYKGLAIAAQGAVNLLYAADFHNARVDVFDGGFRRLAAGGFVDPSLPAGYAPFGIQALGGRIYVAYAKQDAQAHDDVSGAGLGLIDVFDTAGIFVKRLATGGSLNAPWGMALAPANFGAFSNALLVGNFGDGRINAFDPSNGQFLGTLSQPGGGPIVIDGLWGIAFGNGLNSQPVNTLFFAAGPGGEAHGLYGRIDAQ